MTYSCFSGDDSIQEYLKGKKGRLDVVTLDQFVASIEIDPEYRHVEYWGYYRLVQENALGAGASWFSFLILCNALGIQHA
jgi:hypothetical protein